MFGGSVRIHRPSDPFLALKRGDGIVVRFGSKGSQAAIVYSVTGRLLVMKWRAKSHEWTNPVRIIRSDVLRYDNIVLDRLPLPFKR